MTTLKSTAQETNKMHGHVGFFGADAIFPLLFGLSWYYCVYLLIDNAVVGLEHIILDNMHFKCDEGIIIIYFFRTL